MRTNICSRGVTVMLAVILVPVTAFAGQAAQTEARPAVSAPVEDRRGFIGLGFGPSTPFGSFAEASAVDPQAGRATSGYTDTLVNIGYRFGRRFGVATAFSYSEFPMRDGGDDDWWQMGTLTAGPMYSQPIGARAALDLKAMAGLVWVLPVIDSYSTYDGYGHGLGVDLRATIRYDVFRRWALFAEYGLQSSGVTFESGIRKNARARISGFGVAFRPVW